MRVVGQCLVRPDSDAKVRGTAIYPQDRPWPPGTLHAATVRAPLACARLLGINVAPALATAGVLRGSVVVSLPGSTKAVELGVALLAPVLAHMVDLATGRATRHP